MSSVYRSQFVRPVCICIEIQDEYGKCPIYSKFEWNLLSIGLLMKTYYCASSAVIVVVFLLQKFNDICLPDSSTTIL